MHMLGTRSHGLSIITESNPVGEISVGEVAEPTETGVVHDISGADKQYESAGEMQNAVNNGQDVKYQIADFLKRPTYLLSKTYDIDSAMLDDPVTDINPWAGWSNDPTIRSKLNTYAFFRGDLHLEVHVTGSPYAYGKLLVAYVPYGGYNDALQGLLAPITNSTAIDVLNWTQPLLNYLSQQEGSVVIDIKDNQPVDIKIPFVSYKQQFKLYNSESTVITNSDTLEDFGSAGVVYMMPIRAFKMSNDDTDGQIFVNFYAHAENVQLGNTTGTDIDITAQGRRRRKNQKSTSKRAGSLKGVLYQAKGLVDAAIPDEYEADGPVSSVASAVSNAADALKDVPVIGGFAKATAAISGTIGKVASWFGFSKPVELSDPIFVKNNPFQNGANTAGHETITKISCDPKQELDIDLTLSGNKGQDEMTIKELASRESYLTSFTWDQTATPMQTVLWQSLVNPMLYSCGAKDVGSNDLTDYVVQPTSMFFAAAPFNYWRGTIKFRFEFVISRFHRGKVLIKFEPNLPQYSLISSGTSRLNQQNSILIDLQETQDVEIEVDWAQSRAWCSTPAASPNPTTTPCNLTGYTGSAIVGTSFAHTTYDFQSSNGAIVVLPFTNLTQPTTSSDVTCNVYVSCDDLIVARPRDLGYQSRSYTITAESRNVVTTNVMLNPSGADNENIFSHHMGESIASFRALMKRYQCSYISAVSFTAQANDECSVYMYGRTYAPPKSLYAEDVISATAAEQSDLYDYLRFAYMGIRGGMRFRVAFNGFGLTDGMQYARVILEPQNIVDNTTNVQSTDVLTGMPNAITDFIGALGGSQIFHIPSNGGVEFEIPFYCNQLFLLSNNNSLGGESDMFSSLEYDNTMSNDWRVTSNFRGGTIAEGFTSVDRATAEDFTFLRFTGAPWFGVTSS